MMTNISYLDPVSDVPRSVRKEIPINSESHVPLTCNITIKDFSILSSYPKFC